MGIKASSILEFFPKLVQHYKGDPQVTANAPSSINNIQPKSIIYVGKEEHLQLALQSEASLIVIAENLKSEELNEIEGKCLLSTNNIYLAIAQINAQFFPIQLNPISSEAIHPTAVIAETAKIGKNVKIGPHSVIGDQVNIADHCTIGSNTTIDPKAQIGEGTHIHSNVFIAHAVIIGKKCKILPNSTIGTEGFGYAHDHLGNHYEIPHYGPLVIEDDVHIGAGVQIDRGTFDTATIGYGTKIDNHCHIAHNNNIGRNCLITAGFISAGSVTIGDNCVFAGRVTVNGHIKITDNCLFGPFSGVSNNVTKPGKYGGYPLTTFNESLRTYASIAQLTKFRKDLAGIKKQLKDN